MKSILDFKLLILISAIGLILNVGTYGAVESSDARYAEISREMIDSGDFIHPNLLDIYHYHKPPLTYQITALGYKLFGINAFGARFFLQIAILLQLILIYKFNNLLFNNKQSSLWASLIYFSFPIVLASSRNLTTDAFLATFALLCMYAWVKYRKSGKMPYLYLFTISLGLGVLTKGPVIFIVPLPFMIIYNTIEKPKHKLGFNHLFAWLIFIVIALSWFLYLVIENTDFINYFLGRQTVDRFSRNVFNRTEPFWYFLAFGPLAGLPWLFTLPYLILNNKSLFSRRSIFFVLSLGIIIPLIFFSLSSSKRILYILPFYSLIAILIAQLLAKLQDDRTRNIFRFLGGYAFLIFLASFTTLFIKTEFVIPKALGIAGLLLIPVLIWFHKTSRIGIKAKMVYLAYIVSIFLLIGSSNIMALNQIETNSPKPVTDFIIEKQLRDRNILVYNTRKPSIAFGLNKSIISLNDGSKGLKREIQFQPDLRWKNFLIDMKNESEINELKKIMEKQTVLITYKHEIHDNHKWLLEYYENVKKMGKWTIYY